MGAGVAKKYSPIGLDIGAREVFAVQLVRDHAGVRLHRAARPPIAAGGEGGEASGEDWLPGVWGTLRRRGFRGGRVVLAAPPGSTRSSVVECPRTDASGAVDEIVRVELARAHRLEPGRFEMAWWGLPTRANKGGAVLVCACEHEVTSGLNERFVRIGADVGAIDLRSLALARACAGLLSPEPGVLDAIVEIGWERSRVVVVGGGVILYERELPECTLVRARDQIAAELMTEAEIAERALLTVGAETGEQDAGVLAPTVRASVTRLGETLGGELGVSISYAVRNYGIGATGRAVCVGEGAAVPGLCGVIGGAGGMRTSVWSSPGGGGAGPEMAAAWGLAARFG